MGMFPSKQGNMTESGKHDINAHTELQAGSKVRKLKYCGIFKHSKPTYIACFPLKCHLLNLPK